MGEAVAHEHHISIRAETSVADPDECRFTVSQLVHANGPFVFENAEQAAGSPLPARLFALDGVIHVLITESVVTVSKSPDASWIELRAAIGSAIRNQLQSGAPAVLEASYDPTSGRREDDELRKVIERLFEREVNPSIAAHGGKITLVDLRDATLYVAMSGGCQGCASSTVTLRLGVEVMVRRVAPEIVDIIDTTDHSAGAKPFYSRTH